MSLDPSLEHWLDDNASALDAGIGDPATLLKRLADAGLFRIGAPVELDGSGGDISDAVEALAQVAERSLAAGFVFWGHRTYIEYLLQSPNAALRDRHLTRLFDGSLAGATGLSNAMKFLAGLEELQIAAARSGEDFVLDGKMPWVTNLQTGNYLVAAAVQGPDGAPFVASIAHDGAGVERSPDLDLMAMRSTATAAVRLTGVPLPASDVIAADAKGWLPAVRPAFLGLQCGMSIGVARRSIAEAAAAAGSGRHVLRPEIEALSERLAASKRALHEGLHEGVFRTRPQISSASASRSARPRRKPSSSSCRRAAASATSSPPAKASRGAGARRRSCRSSRRASCS
ncbi:acyl-CoA dehydrogenase family protein [Chenggangzhangella methanolivorans]|uniref:acyl-CoA dehydrogenase family protein n=1 Tax=Chenggangzhangella methanolivorans TaxID=1437009 RepID=UPI0021BDB681|nr:acyl-CoA dehydrogenase family protein [Chenggangzhangella methanolivorans]